MLIKFNFNGDEHKAEVMKQVDKSINVNVHDENLNKKFGSSFQFFINNKTLGFKPLNLCHSELFNLQKAIKNAIVSQGLRF
jgi:hypothetical protein